MEGCRLTNLIEHEIIHFKSGVSLAQAILKYDEIFAPNRIINYFNFNFSDQNINLENTPHERYETFDHPMATT